MSRVKAIDHFEERNKEIEVEKTMTTEQKKKKLFDDCMADPEVTGSYFKGTKEEQCKDESWYAWFMGLIDQIKEYLAAAIKYIEKQIIKVKVLVTNFVKQREFGTLRLWELSASGDKDIFVDGHAKEVLYCADKIDSEDGVDYYGYRLAEKTGSGLSEKIECGKQYLCWDYSFFGKDEVKLQNAKFRKDQNVLKSESNTEARVRFYHQKMETGVKDKKDCHWSYLSYEDGMALPQPKMSWATWFSTLYNK